MTERGKLIARRLLEDYNTVPVRGPGSHLFAKALLKRAMHLIQHEAEEAGMVDTWTPKQEEKA